MVEIAAFHASDFSRAKAPRWKALARAALGPIHRAVITPYNLRRNASKRRRRLEIGPGGAGIRGFETLDLRASPRIDYVGDGRSLPFPDDVFEVVYASHILEHVPWFETERVVREWTRVLTPGGALEIWVPDGLKLAKAFVEAEETGTRPHSADGWWRFNPERDPCVWMSGRTFSYGDGTARGDHPNWHRALFSERRLRDLLARVGLIQVRRMGAGEVRGYDHGWINLGVRGVKPA